MTHRRFVTILDFIFLQKTVNWNDQKLHMYHKEKEPRTCFHIARRHRSVDDLAQDCPPQKTTEEKQNWDLSFMNINELSLAGIFFPLIRF